MKLIPASVSRSLAEKALRTRMQSPSILFGIGVVSMVGSTVLACRATLKVEEVLHKVESDKAKAALAKEMVDNGAVPEGTTYTDEEVQKDMYIILARGAGNLVKLYAPAIIVGGIGIVCLSKSHNLLKERNLAITAAYVAVDRAFTAYRERVVDRFGDETDRELRYDYEEVDVIEEETGKVVSTIRAPEGDHGMYARWFDKESTSMWNPPEFAEYNWMHLRQQQNWANDMLKARGHMFLNEVYRMLGLSETSAGQIVGWVYAKDNPRGDNYVDFGCWGQQDEPSVFHNGREGAILLDFNVDGSVWQLLDERRNS